MGEATTELTPEARRARTAAIEMARRDFLPFVSDVLAGTLARAATDRPDKWRGGAWALVDVLALRNDEAMVLAVIPWGPRARTTVRPEEYSDHWLWMKHAAEIMQTMPPESLDAFEATIGAMAQKIREDRARR